MERNITPPPRNAETLEQWATFFGLEGEERTAFFDRAALARQEIPRDVASDERVLEALPVLFRAARSRPLDDARLESLIEDIRALHSPDLEPQAARWMARRNYGLGSKRFGANTCMQGELHPHPPYAPLRRPG